jgi:DNA-binding transcriptional regulator YiaG
MNEIRLESTPDLPPLHKRQEIRTSAGLSVTQLGAAVGVSAASIGHWETGLREPRGLQRIAYAQVLATLAAESAGGAE